MHFERTALPTAGGVYEQPARTMEALSVLERVAGAVLAERAKERREKDRAKARARTAGRRRRR